MPPDPAVYVELLQIHHDNALAGHFSKKKTLDLLTRKYYWPSINADVVSYISTCDLCQRMRAPRHRPYGKLQALPCPDQPW